MHEAKSTLSKLVERVEAGEEVQICRDGVPVARLVPPRPQGKRVLGQWRGKVKMSPDFDAPLPAEHERAWTSH